MANQILGRGKLYFEPEGESGERYLGNAPTTTINRASQTLDHYASTGGTKVLDNSVTLQVDEGVKFELDEIVSENLAMFYTGSAANDDQSVAAGPFTETFTVQKDRWYQVGVTVGRPEGITGIGTFSAVKNVAAVAATGNIVFAANPSNNATITLNGTAVTFKTTAGASPEVQIGATLADTLTAALAILNASADAQLVKFEYEVDATTLYLTAATAGTAGNSLTIAASVATPSGATLSGGAAASTPSITLSGNITQDAANGRFYIEDDAAGVDNDDSITISYAKTAVTKDRVISSRTTLYGALRFIADNPAGSDRNFYWPRVSLSPDGDYQLLGDEWQKMGFSAKILERDTSTSGGYITVKA